MVQVSKFGGKRICAKKMNAAFEDVQLVGKLDSCKSGYTKCPEDSSAKNKICIPSDKSNGKCPINGLHFLEK